MIRINEKTTMIKISWFESMKIEIDKISGARDTEEIEIVVLIDFFYILTIFYGVLKNLVHENKKK